MRLFSFLLGIAVLVLSTGLSASAGLTLTLGEQDFTDGAMLTPFQYDDAQLFELAPFDIRYGFDDDTSFSFSQSWTFSYGALTEPTASASITIGVFDHDSARDPEQQVQSFDVDGHDLTSFLNTVFESSGGSEVFPTSEYNVYTVALPSTAFADLADGTATFTLTLTNGFVDRFGVPTNTVYNSMGLDFSTLDITTQGIAPVPEPSTLVMSALAGIAAFGLGWRRRRRKPV
jgi:hypothetical protein